MSVWTFIKGGWRTWGPNSGSGSGGFASNDDPSYNVTATTALNLSAVFGCVSMRGETIGAFPIHVRDAKKNILDKHPLTRVLTQSPNAEQTPAEFWSLQSAFVDLHGNGLSIVERRRSGEVISLDTVPNPDQARRSEKKSGRYGYILPGDNTPYDANNILHMRGFALDPLWGCSRIDIGRQILAAQLGANDSAFRAFRQSIKGGGFFEMDRDLTTTQRKDLEALLKRYAQPENDGTMLALLKGMKPVPGGPYRIKPAEAELLQSRAFGIEEICRLFGVPPPLIGHTDKASSWASSIEMLNLFFLVYGLQPSLVRMEQRIAKTLLTPEDRANGIRVKFNVDGLLRGNTKDRIALYASGLQNGWLSQNDVRDLEDRIAIPDGDEYRVQLNMANADQAKPDDEKDDKK